FFIFVANLLGFESDEAPAGVGIVGVDLTSGDLKYFTGEKWRTIPIDKEVFKIGGYTFAPKTVKETFSRFYVDPQNRRPQRLVFEVGQSKNKWRYWEVFSYSVGFNGVNINDILKNSYAGPQKIFTLSLANDGALNGGFERYLEDFSLNNIYTGDILKIVAWRDQILEGNSCEKFLILNLKKDDLDAPKKFTVRKIDNYIFVDLEKPVFEGTLQKWDNVGCFSAPTYTDFDRSSWSNEATVQFSYTEKDGKNGLEKVWWLPQSGWVYVSHDTDGDDVLFGRKGFENFVSLEKDTFSNVERNYILFNGNKAIPKTPSKSFKSASSFYFAYYDTSKITDYFKRDKCENCLMLFAEIPGETFKSSLDGYPGLPVAYFDKSGILKQGDLNIPSYAGTGESTTFISSDFLHSLYGKTKNQFLQGFKPNWSPYNALVPRVFYNQLKGKDFYEGLVELAKVGGILEKQDAQFDENDRGVFVKGKDGLQVSVNVSFSKDKEWGEFSDKQNRINRFIYDVLDAYNQHLNPSDSLSTPVLELPEYFFLIEDIDADINAILFDKNGVDKSVTIFNGIITSGPLTLGTVSSEGIINIVYTSAGIDVGQVPYIDFINGENFFDIVYGINPTSAIGYSKLQRWQIPSGVLGASP
ncbi:MAG: hypothetical protein AABY16_03355, partial [Nanoarchaeota archaeon]